MNRLVPSVLVALLAFAVQARASEPVAESANPSLQKEVEDYLAETGPQAADTTFRAFWKNGLWFETADKAFTAHVGGRIAFDGAYFGSDDYGGTEKQDSWYFRELFMTTEGTMYTNGVFRIEVDFSTGAVVLKECYVGMRNLGPAGTFQAGQFKTPFSIGDVTSFRFITFMERSAPTSAFCPSYQDGFMLWNNFLEQKRLFAAIGVFKLTVNGTATDNGGYGVAGRFAAFFLEDEEAHRILHVGFCVLYAGTPAGTQQYRARPDIGTGARFVDTGTFAADDTAILDLEVLYTWRKLHVQGEYYWTETSGGGGPEPTFTGFYVEVGWFLSGGRVNYNKDKKVLDRPTIEQDWHAASGGRGAWQIAVRYDNVDLTDSGVAGGLQQGVTFGVNWYWNPNMRMMFNVIWMDISEGGPFGDGNLAVFGTRFQADF